MIKVIACISMLFDHLRYAIPEINDYFFLKNIGRLSFPLFAFCIVEGYIHTKNLKKYLLRLFVFGLISQYPFMLFRTLVNDYFYINIMFTFILGIIAIMCIDKIDNKIIGTILSLIVIALGKLLHVDYFGVPGGHDDSRYRQGVSYARFPEWYTRDHPHSSLSWLTIAPSGCLPNPSHRFGR